MGTTPMGTPARKAAAATALMVPSPPRRHQQTSVIACSLCCVIRQLNDIATLTRYVPHHGMVVLGKGTTQLCAHQIQIGPWPQWNHHMDGTVVMKDHGTVQIGHGDQKRGGRNDACEAKDPTRGRYSMITAQWLQRSQRVAPWCVGVRLQTALRIAA